MRLLLPRENKWHIDLIKFSCAATTTTTKYLHKYTKTQTNITNHAEQEEWCVKSTQSKTI